MRILTTVTAAGLLLASVAGQARAIPAWARKYNMNCDGCHYPAPPRLNAQGLRFRWAGYRMPDDFNEQADVQRVANYIAANGTAVWEYQKTSGSPTDANGLSLDNLTLWYAGPFGRNFSGFFELEREAPDELGAIAQVEGVWGRPQAYGGARVGQMHVLFEGGVAGFDRPVSISTPLAVDPVTAGIPFSMAEHQLGVEGFYVTGSNRVSAMMLNGIENTGEPAGSDHTQKDFAVSDQLLLDSHGSAVYALVYRGTVVGLDPAAATNQSHFVRVAVSASKVVSNVELLGGFVYGRDSDLPTGPGLFAADHINGAGYWFSGQYALGGNGGAVYGRYEFVDPDRDVADNGMTRFVVGGILPLTLPQYLRVTAEVGRIQPQGSGAPATMQGGVAVNLTF